MAMPKVNIEKVNVDGDDRKIFNLIVKKNGEIRATKPVLKHTDPLTGKAAYVWRMVCFIVSSKPQHHCMPVCAVYDLPAYDENGKWKSRIADEMANELKPLEDAIMGAVDKGQWHGAHRWGKALGYL